MPGELYVAGEDIAAGEPVICCAVDGKLYSPPCTAGHYVGDAGSNLREGFRVQLRPDGELHEDDA